MRRLQLTYSACSSDSDSVDINEMAVLAASLEDCHELAPGDILWAKLSGMCIWNI